MIYFFTRAQFEARLGSKKVKRIYDENNDGLPDNDPVNRLRADATSKVRSYLEPMGIMPALEALFNQTSGELLNNNLLPDEVVRLSLDVGVALACQRHPEIMRQDWRVLMDQSDKELTLLRAGKTSLGGGTQAGNTTPKSEVTGAKVVKVVEETENEAEHEPRWSSGRMGDYS